MTREEQFQYIAASHVEFILIHLWEEWKRPVSQIVDWYDVSKSGLWLLDYSLWDEIRVLF